MRLDPSMECQDVVDYLREHKDVSYIVEKLKPKYPSYSSFKIGIPISLYCTMSFMQLTSGHLAHSLHFKKLAGEKSYLIKLLQDGWKPSVKEERNVNTEHVLVDPLLRGTTDDLHVQTVMALLKEDRCWTCVEISRELGIAASTVHTILRKKDENAKSLFQQPIQNSFRTNDELLQALARGMDFTLNHYNYSISWSCEKIILKSTTDNYSMLQCNFSFLYMKMRRGYNVAIIVFFSHASSNNFAPNIGTCIHCTVMRENVTSGLIVLDATLAVMCFLKVVDEEEEEEEEEEERKTKTNLKKSKKKRKITKKKNHEEIKEEERGGGKAKEIKE
ncbi:hypothetical protein C0J52_14412 [Blattella germanica]|nr:hypothetical protein C0J52_14412 [Blattella germanica]